MKKILFTILLFLPTYANSDVMCVRDNTLLISLDASINGTQIYSKNWKWAVEFPYGQIHGESTCLSTTETMGQSDIGASYGTGEYANTLISAEPGMRDTDTNGNERGVCVCRMTHPAQSAWVIMSTFSSAKLCANNCTSGCSYIHIKGNIRSEIFKTIGL